ncbi:tRNA pseudouridine(55) synthase TruB [Leptospira idonii]|uniref:tRNA pseudouridine synthase B n=1 Tax=Leptospira idonii TaxID=1193500 RepID=A0A4R9M3B7_9LEPT|nr:tRNA pseudouridine(55) synthase TruB [Leptospira idonii]TGN19298.1 tRNA pseudouridine(55) synthase TruB [Leptospira idonii]
MPHQERSGYLFVRKSPGLTSSDVVIRLKKRLHLDSIGHTGTLDRFAEGLLIIPFGDYTTFSQLFLGQDKSYYAEVLLGKKTDSGDPDGIVEEEWEESKIKSFIEKGVWGESFLEKELSNLTSWTTQKAPKISALKVGGSRQSDLVRTGRKVVEKERPIRIERVWDIRQTEKGFSFRIHVSSGTYIRKIILDLSEKWEVPLQLERLVRETIGPWGLDLATDYEIIEESQALPWQKVLPLPARMTDEREKKAVIHGGYIWDKLPKAGEDGFYLLEEGTESILAWCLYQGKPSHLPYRYGKVFFDPTQKIMFSK